MIKNRAEEFLREVYSLPLNKNDLETFAQQVLIEFIEELENKKRAVVWNYGLDEVIFLDKLKELKELYGIAND
jgi:hypothetical protein